MLKPIISGVNLKSFVLISALSLFLGTTAVYPQSPDSLIVTNAVAFPGDTAIVSIMLHNTQFSVGGFAARFVLLDSVNASFQRVERGADIGDFDHFSVRQSAGTCKLVGVADLPGGNNAPPLPIGLSELARVFIFIEDAAPWGEMDSVLFMDDTLPPGRDNSISDSTGYINEVPTLIGGEIIFDIGSGIEELPEGVPIKVELYQSYPNPFNAETTIPFGLSADVDEISLSIYDIVGRRVRNFCLSGLPPGQHQVIWYGVDDNGRPLASGIYFYRLETGSLPAIVKRMTLLK